MIPQNPKFKLGENNEGFKKQRLNINPDNAVITVPASYEGKWITAQVSLSKWNEQVILKDEYELKYTASNDYQNILKNMYDYYYEDAQRYFRIDNTDKSNMDTAFENWI